MDGGVCASTKELSKPRCVQMGDTWRFRCRGVKPALGEAGEAWTTSAQTRQIKFLSSKRWCYVTLRLDVDTPGWCYRPGDARADIFHGPSGVRIVLEVVAVRASGA